MDSFFGIGLFELVMIAVVALLVLGPERLPGAMREIAKWMRQLRNLSSEFQSQFSEEFKLLDEMNPRRIINEVMDPNAVPKPAPGQPAKPLAGQPAKPAAPKPVTPAAKAPAPKPAPAPASAAGATAAAALANGEPQNTILPPALAPAPAFDAVAPTAEVLASAPPPAVPPAASSPEAGESWQASHPANPDSDSPTEARQ